MIEDIYPLTPLQQALLFHALGAPSSRVGVESVSWVLRGPLDISAFRCAWQQLVDRHAILRTAFAWEDIDEPMQLVYRRVDLPLVVHDWRVLEGAEQQQRLAALRATLGQPMDLTEPPLLRLALLKLADNEFQVLWSFHHLLLDGWSVALVIWEFFRLYDAARGGGAAGLPPAAPFREYIAWLKGQDLAAAETFWRRTLGGFTQPTGLYLAKAPNAPLNGTAADAIHTIRLSSETTAALQGTARSAAVTVSTIVQAAWGLLLSRCTGETDVVFGATVSGRPEGLPRVDAMVGMFINNVPVRVRVEEDTTISGWLQRLQLQQAEARAYEFAPPTRIQSWSSVPPALPLFESLVVFENYPVSAQLEADGGALQLINPQGGVRTTYPLTLTALPGTTLGLSFSYDPRRFDATAIVRLADHLKNILEDMARHPTARLAEIQHWTDDQERLLRGNDEGVVLDARGHLSPVGAAGLLHLPVPTLPASAGVALSAPDPTTVDLLPTAEPARYRQDGSIERLEQEEQRAVSPSLRFARYDLQAWLARHPAVRQSAVLLEDGPAGERCMVAYVVSRQTRSNLDGTLRASMRAALPVWMLPSEVVTVDALPRRASSDVTSDRRRPAEDWATHAGAPRDATDARLVAIWEAVLGVRPIQPTDDFFVLGGTSFTAVRLLERVEEVFGQRLSPTVLFQRSTVADFAAVLRARDRVELPGCVLPVQPQGTRPALFFAHGPFDYLLYYRYLAQHLGPNQPVYVMRWQPDDPAEPRIASTEELAIYYLAAMRAIQPTGPYFLGGHSYGGVVAFEMARQLRVQGEAVGLIALFDTWCPLAMPDRGLTLRQKLQHHTHVLWQLDPLEKVTYLRERLRGLGEDLGLGGRSADAAAWAVATDLLRRYVPRAYPGRLTIFWADYAPKLMGFPEDPRAAWGRVAAGGLNIRKVPGDHVLMLTRPRVHQLGEALKDCLLSAQEAAGSHPSLVRVS